MKQKCLMVVIILLLIGANIPFNSDVGYSKKILTNNRDPPPPEEWNRTYGPLTNETQGNCIQLTPDGGFIVTGYTGGGMWYDVYLLKVDNEGNEEWNRSFRGQGESERLDLGNWVEVTSDNGYIIAGQNGYNVPNVWLIKTDVSGNEEWNRTFGGSDVGIGNCVKQTRDGGYIITGRPRNVSGNLFLIKTDALGNELWRNTYEDDYGSTGNSLVLTPDDGYVVTGMNNSGKLLLLKTDGNGTLQWEREYSTNASCYQNWGREVQLTSDGGYIVGGTTSCASCSTSLWLLKTDQNGVEQWNQTFGDTGFDDYAWGYSVIQTSNGDFVIGGIQLGVPRRFWLIRTQADGTVLWENFYMSPLNALCFCIRETLDKGIIATGDRYPRCVILKISGGNHPPSSSGIEGPHRGMKDKDYSFSINATDPEGDALCCLWDWGDGNITGWLGPYACNQTVHAVHAWSKKETYSIRVKLKDFFGHETNWSVPHDFIVGEMKNVFLFGRYRNMTMDGDSCTISAVNMRMILFKPIQYFNYVAGETITLLQNKSKVLIFPHRLIGVASIMN